MTLQLPSPYQQKKKVFDFGGGKKLHQLNMHEFIMEQQLVPGTKLSREQMVKGARISAYEHQLQACGANHFWSWNPDERLSNYWNSLSEEDHDLITHVDDLKTRELLWERVRKRRGHVCFSKLDPVHTAKTRRFMDDEESLYIYKEMFRT